QRLRDWTDRERTLSALRHRPGDAQDAADIAVPRSTRPVFRRPGGVAVNAVAIAGAAGVCNTSDRMLKGFRGTWLRHTKDPLQAALGPLERAVMATLWRGG